MQTFGKVVFYLVVAGLIIGLATAMFGWWAFMLFWFSAGFFGHLYSHRRNTGRLPVYD